MGALIPARVFITQRHVVKMIPVALVRNSSKKILFLMYGVKSSVTLLPLRKEFVCDIPPKAFIFKIWREILRFCSN